MFRIVLNVLKGSLLLVIQNFLNFFLIVLVIYLIYVFIYVFQNVFCRIVGVSGVLRVLDVF